MLSSVAGPTVSPFADATAPLGRATRTRSTFRLAYAVTVAIHAPRARVWTLLTSLDDMPRWNSTVTSIRGRVEAGARVELVAAIAPSRTFKLGVREVVDLEKLVFGDGFAPMFEGVRTYRLADSPGGVTAFTMDEVFRGAMLPLVAKSLPDFTASFEQYAADLKREAERS